MPKTIQEFIEFILEQPSVILIAILIFIGAKMLVRFLNDLILLIVNLKNALQFILLKLPLIIINFFKNILNFTKQFLLFITMPIRWCITIPSRNQYYKDLKLSIFNIEVLENKTTF